MWWWETLRSYYTDLDIDLLVDINKKSRSWWWAAENAKWCGFLVAIIAYEGGTKFVHHNHLKQLSCPSKNKLDGHTSFSFTIRPKVGITVGEHRASQPLPPSFPFTWRSVTQRNQESVNHSPLVDVDIKGGSSNTALSLVRRDGFTVCTDHSQVLREAL